MMHILFFNLFLILSLVSIAQNKVLIKEPIRFQWQAGTSNAFNTQIYGLGIEMKVPNSLFGYSGLGVNRFQVNIDNLGDGMYNNTLVNIDDYGLINEIPVFTSNNFFLNAFATIGLTRIRVGSEDIRTGVRNRSELIRIDNLLLIQPGLMAAYKLCKTEKDNGIYLFIDFRYRYLPLLERYSVNGMGNSFIFNVGVNYSIY